MYNTVNSAQKVILEVFNYIGLKDFNGELIAMEYDSKHSVRFYTEINIYKAKDQKTLIDNVLMPIVEAVKNSDAVQDAKAELTSQIVVLQDELDKLNKENEYLKKFKTYYDMNFAMQHGKTTRDLDYE